jgi:hypothetical protein
MHDALVTRLVGEPTHHRRGEGVRVRRFPAVKVKAKRLAFSCAMLTDEAVPAGSKCALRVWRLTSHYIESHRGVRRHVYV